MSTATVNIDEITSIGERLPIGRYFARLASVEAKLSKSQKPMVVALFEVSEGEHEGLETVIYYSLFVSQKNGRKYAGGILDLKRAFNVIGTALPPNFQMPCASENTTEEEALANADKVRKLYAKNFANKIVEIAVLEDKGRKSDNPDIKYTRTQVIGLKKAAAKPASTGDIFDDLEEES